MQEIWVLVRKDGVHRRERCLMSVFRVSNSLFCQGGDTRCGIRSGRGVCRMILSRQCYLNPIKGDVSDSQLNGEKKNSKSNPILTKLLMKGYLDKTTKNNNIINVINNINNENNNNKYITGPILTKLEITTITSTAITIATIN